MAIEIGVPITQEEFERIRPNWLGKKCLPETTLVLALEPMQGVKFPCRWKHSKFGQCNGVNTTRIAAKRHGFRLSGRCKDGMVYVFRYE